jgi:hypothetical protein
LTNNIVKTQDWDKNKIFYKLNETSLLGSCKSYKENGDSALYQGIEDFNSKKCYKIRYVKNYKKFDNTSGYKNLEYHFFDILNSLEVGLKNFDNDGNEIVTIGENFTKINGVYQAQKLTLKKRGEIVAILNLKGFSNDIILPDKEFEKAAYTK